MSTLLRFRPEFWLEGPARRDFVVFSLHASVTCGRIECHVGLFGFYAGFSA